MKYTILLVIMMTGGALGDRNVEVSSDQGNINGADFLPKSSRLIYKISEGDLFVKAIDSLTLDGQSTAPESESAGSDFKCFKTSNYCVRGVRQSFEIYVNDGEFKPVFNFNGLKEERYINTLVSLVEDSDFFIGLGLSNQGVIRGGVVNLKYSTMDISGFVPEGLEARSILSFRETFYAGFTLYNWNQVLIFNIYSMKVVRKWDFEAGSLAYLDKNPSLAKLAIGSKFNLKIINYVTGGVMKEVSEGQIFIEEIYAIDESDFLVVQSVEYFKVFDSSSMTNFDSPVYTYTDFRSLNGIRFDKKEGAFLAFGNNFLNYIQLEQSGECHENCQGCTVNFSPYFCRSCASGTNENEEGKCVLGGRSAPPDGFQDFRVLILDEAGREIEEDGSQKNFFMRNLGYFIGGFVVLFLVIVGLVVYFVITTKKPCSSSSAEPQIANEGQAQSPPNLSQTPLNNNQRQKNYRADEEQRNLSQQRRTGAEEPK